jgi:hypothetical protein
VIAFCAISKKKCSAGSNDNNVEAVRAVIDRIEATEKMGRSTAPRDCALLDAFDLGPILFDHF